MRISEVAATEGLGPWRGASWRVSSHDAHRLLALAHERAGSGVRDALAEGLMRAYFLQGRDIGDRTVLRDVALRADFVDDPAVRILAARAYFGSAQLKRARTVLEPLVEQRPDDFYVRMLYGRTLQRLGLDAQARPHLRLALAMSD